MSLISLVIFLPLVGALIAMLMPNVRAVRWTALLTTTATFIASLFLYAGFDAAADPGAPQMSDVLAWFPNTADIKYFVGIDGLNLLLVILTTLLARFRFAPAGPDPHPIMHMTVRPAPGVTLTATPI